MAGVLLPHEGLNEVQELNEVDASGTISIKVIEYTLNLVRTYAPACQTAADRSISASRLPLTINVWTRKKLLEQESENT